VKCFIIIITCLILFLFLSALCPLTLLPLYLSLSLSRCLCPLSPAPCLLSPSTSLPLSISLPCLYQIAFIEEAKVVSPSSSFGNNPPEDVYLTLPRLQLLGAGSYQIVTISTSYRVLGGKFHPSQRVIHELKPFSSDVFLVGRTELKPNSYCFASY